MEVARTNAYLRGMKIVRGVKAINHAQFTDDTLLLGGDSTVIAHMFKNILDKYLKVSRGGAVDKEKKQDLWLELLNSAAKCDWLHPRIFSSARMEILLVP